MTRQPTREALASAISKQIASEVGELLSGYSDVAEEARWQIQDNILVQTCRVLDSLTLKELQSPFALERHIESCLIDARVKQSAPLERRAREVKRQYNARPFQTRMPGRKHACKLRMAFDPSFRKSTEFDPEFSVVTGSYVCGIALLDLPLL